MRQLAQELVERAEHHADDVAVIDADGVHTLGRVVAQAGEIADLLDRSLTGAPTVLVQADNTWRTLAAAIAVGLRGGLIAVISGHAAKSEYDLALEDIQPDAVIASPQAIATWQVDDGELPVVGEAFPGWSVRAAASRRTRGVERWRGGVAIAMTSGSTGRPKCVVQSEEALRYAGQATIDAVGLEPGDPVGALVPLSSVAAFCFGLHLPAMLGSPMVCLDRWSPEDAVALLRDEKVAWTMLVPTMALQLSLVPGSDGALTSLRAMTVGGGPMNATALERAERHLGTRFLRVFGMSECLGHTTPLPAEDADVRLGRDGRPFPGTLVRIVGADGAPLPDGEVGNAQVRGPSLFVGYARDGVPVPPEVTADGFFPTGDRARINDDGTINILGREKQVIIRGGRNLDINEVEAAVAAIPGVAQVCIVPVPDDLLGERAAALVVWSGEPLDLDGVRRELAAADFPKFKWPEFVYDVAHLPQNRVGKLDRSGAISLASSLAAAGIAAPAGTTAGPAVP
ncbi:AMP-binding protein [Pimelobacter simplex]|uniref:class I adenylate-forming enzyme family protein n=1 Tax=Nocardioides simplex TaxID=2045 RepID=UPI000691ABD9|nr:class I adenylate-forming enzyme family protein [Pimelobacter simplex]MCG8154522.1 AMP-binding protein [Pimelobacter simplex]GEB12571.1 malonyl-CoA synthase [Pimelobacter simplex]SFM93154.1 Acyl-CoA synthetase (AMP-forming)/AMP-acid ligase II [Pimelobacter simplex]